MKTVDYEIGWEAGKAKIRARSEGAKKRTPDALSMSIGAALDWVKSSEAQGYWFLGVETVDPSRKRLRNGYFFLGDGGQLIPAGGDTGPYETVYEVGDTVMGGPRKGKEAVIEKIISGESAKPFGFGRVFILRERDVSQTN